MFAEEHIDSYSNMVGMGQATLLIFDIKKILSSVSPENKVCYTSIVLVNKYDRMHGLMSLSAFLKIESTAWSGHGASSYDFYCEIFYALSRLFKKLQRFERS